MSWKYTINDYVELLSPNGDLFFAYWRENERSFERKLGVFDMPRFDGTIVQDLGVKSVRYPLTLFFEGRNNQDDAEDFFTALYEQPGQWEVAHPTKGKLALQLISCNEAVSGVEPNTTEISTEWIQPANVEITLSLDESLFDTLTAIASLVDDALSGLASIRTNSYALIQSTINTFNTVAGLGNSFFDQLNRTTALAQDAYDSAVSAFNTAVNDYEIGNTDPKPMADAMAGIIGVPATASDDLSSRLDIYESFIDSGLNLAPDTATTEDINTLLSMEYSILISLSVISNIIVTSTYKSRTDVISALQAITDLFNSVIENLDNNQTKFVSLDIDDQFFSNVATYTSLNEMFSKTVIYLMKQFYSLSSEKTITLKTARSPIEITVTEYGTLGENDFTYDLFLDSNNLQGNEILILPAGKEVVIYV